MPGQVDNRGSESQNSLADNGVQLLQWDKKSQYQLIQTIDNGDIRCTAPLADLFPWPSFFLYTSLCIKSK
jgi:hypothetical protein